MVNSNPQCPAQAVENIGGPLITLVVPYGEVGVVSSLGSQAVVEVLAAVGIVLVHCTHCLDQLGEGMKSGESESTRRVSRADETPHPEIQ